MLNLGARGEVARVKRELLLAADENQLEPHEQLWLWVTAEAFVTVARFNAEANRAIQRLEHLKRSERIALENVAKRRLNSIQGELEWFSGETLSPHRIVCRGLCMSEQSIERLEEQIRRDLLLAHSTWEHLLTELGSVGALGLN